MCSIIHILFILFYLICSITSTLSYILIRIICNWKIIFLKAAMIWRKSVNVANDVHDCALRLLSPFRILEFEITA